MGERRDDEDIFFFFFAHEEVGCDQKYSSNNYVHDVNDRMAVADLMHITQFA